jgi:hypothetical protein
MYCIADASRSSARTRMMFGFPGNTVATALGVVVGVGVLALPGAIVATTLSEGVGVGVFVLPGGIVATAVAEAAGTGVFALPGRIVATAAGTTVVGGVLVAGVARPQLVRNKSRTTAGTAVLFIEYLTFPLGQVYVFHIDASHIDASQLARDDRQIR